MSARALITAGGLAALAIATLATLALADGRGRRVDCVEPGSADVSAAQQAAADWTRRSYQRTLAKRGLVKQPLGTRRLELHRGIGDGVGSKNKALPYDKATATALDGKRGVYIGGVSEWSGNARHQPAWEFVRNARGEIFRVRRAPQITTSTIPVCGCQPQVCGPYGSGCPACGSTAQTVYGPLPDGAVYRGELVVAYPARDIGLQYKQTQGCKVRRCPAPPPSVNRSRP